MSEVISKFSYDTYYGTLEGLFISEKQDIINLTGKELHFGEVLGKHSEVTIILESKHLTMISDDVLFIESIKSVFGSGTIIGYNPLDYCDDCRD